MKYNIVCVADEGYVQHAAVMLSSLFETNSEKSFCIYFMTYTLSGKSKNSLNSLCNAHNSQIIFIEDNYEIIKDFKVGQWNTIMYLKLLVPQYLPKDVERYLFLDVDMIINSDITELYHYDLGNNIIAACEDIPDCIIHKKRLNLPNDSTYINSGVIVVDLKAWRAKGEDWIECMNRKEVDFINDQDVIATYFENEIKVLPIKWNMVTFYYMRKPKIFEKYLATLEYDKKNPCIIHFPCPIKPWFKDCKHPYAHMYRKHLSKTDWKDYEFPYFEKLSKWGRFKKCIRNILNKAGIIKDEIFLIK